MKKKILMMIFFIMVIWVTAGCSKKEKEPEVKHEVFEKGRYIEHEIGLPELGEGEWIFSMFRNKKGEVEVYTYLSTEDKHLCYLLSEGSKEWVEQDASWINSIDELENNPNIKYIQEGEDGLRYFLYADRQGKSFIYKTQDMGKTAQKVKIPYLDKKNRSIEEFRVLEGGSIVVNDGISNTLKIYSGIDGQETGSFKFGGKKSVNVGLSVKGNKIITIGEDRKSVIVYDVEKAKVEQRFDYEFVKDDTVKFAMSDMGIVFSKDSKGIHRIQTDGTVWETVYQSTIQTIEPQISYFDVLFDGEENMEKYYVFTSEKMLYYDCDETVDKAFEKQISIYSLYENRMIDEVIKAYQKNNLDIKVDYTVAFTGEEGGTVSDMIRVLNTELLAGKGPDILILDGLPVDSYIESGVLADMSRVINSLDVVENIKKAYVKEDGIYQLPVKFTVPFIQGNEEVISSSGSIEDIVSYIGKNPKIPFIRGYDNESLTRSMLTLSNSEFTESDGIINKEKFIKFLKNLKIISENIDAGNYKEHPRTEKYSMEFTERWGFTGSYGALFNKKYAASYRLAGSTASIGALVSLKKQFQYPYRMINKLFIPMSCVGVSNSSEDKETAFEFIKFLFNSDIYNGGLPVNERFLDKYMKSEDWSVGKWDPIRCESVEAHMNWREGSATPDTIPRIEQPSNLSYEEQIEFLEMFKEVNKPVKTDRILQDMMLEPVIKYLSGSISAEQAAETVVSKVNIYVSE